MIIICRYILWFGSDTYFFHFTSWIPSVVLSSLLCFDHQLYLVHVLTSSLFLLIPFSCVFTSSSCCDHFLTEFLYLYSFSSLVVCVMIARYLLLLFLSILFYYYLNAFISCIRVVLYLFLLTFSYWIPFNVLSPLLCCDHKLRSLHSLLTSFTFHIGSLQLCLVLYFASLLCFMIDTYFFHFYF